VSLQALPQRKVCGKTCLAKPVAKTYSWIMVRHPIRNG
jgi:hypothetical protein